MKVVRCSILQVMFVDIKIERESHDLKEEMIPCLVELVKDKTTKDQKTSKEWIDLIDRGGLCHVKEAVVSCLRVSSQEMS